MRPQIGNGCTILDSARVVGNVSLGNNVFVLFGAVLRGDSGTIRVGDRTNIQDNVVVHADPGNPAEIGSDVSIGHGAVVHGCTIGDACIVGINSVVLNGAKVGRGCIIGAGCVISENAVIPDFSLVVGVPGKVVRTNSAFADRALMNAAVYQKFKAEYTNNDTHIIWKNSKL